MQGTGLKVEPWRLVEGSFDLDRLPQIESIFALSNGHLGLRANLDEGEPYYLPGTYLNSVYELRPLPYAEAGFGYPESGQSIINVTDGKLIRLLVDDEPFDVRYGQLRHHRRVLDLNAGTLHRDVDWISPAGRNVKISSTRLVSFTHRSIAAINYSVEAAHERCRVVIQSELVANEPVPDLGRDPRVAAALGSPLVAEEHGSIEGGAVLIHRTAESGIRIAAAMDHLIDGPEDAQITSDVYPDLARITITATLEPGERLTVTKFLAYGWSEVRSRQALFDQVNAALTGAQHTGWQGLLDDQREYLDDFWDGADVQIVGDPQIQQAVRVGLFHVLQAGTRAERRPIPAKGLTGTGYEGHVFWDSEMYVLPVLTYTVAKAAADALRWRLSTLPKAKARAAALGLKGAAFPWRTIAGEECSGYWPAGTAGFHINADIAYAVTRYLDATEDIEFERDVGLELLVETARLWMSLGHFDREARFRIDGVTGPDEYSAIADNNVYTNLMARHNLQAAAEVAEKHFERSRQLKVSDEEVAHWRSAGAAMYIPYDERLKIHPQSEAFTLHQVWDFAHTDPANYPLLLHYPYFDMYRKQVVKQADLVFAMFLFPDEFDIEQKARNFAYYERITVRDSSLSAAIQAVMASEVGHLNLAYRYLEETALVDLANLQSNTRDGVHMAALAGIWTALVCGFGGMRLREGTVSFAPRLPDGLTGLTFSICYRECRIQVDAGRTSVSYALKTGEALTVLHHGEKVILHEGDGVTMEIPPLTPREEPTQPPGREPRGRPESRSSND